MQDNTAHFFWHGKISPLERSCILSFKNHGFNPVIWGYDQIDIPNVEYRNAKEILTIDHLKKYSQYNKTSNLSAFSDVFRINLINKYRGWWFDTDCYCLKDIDEFNTHIDNRPIILGSQDEDIVACGVVKCNDKNISELLLKKLNKKLTKHNNHVPRWGDIGPYLFTEVINELNLNHHILKPDYFYPVHYDDFRLLVDSSQNEYVKERCNNSFIIHLWNEMLVKYKIDKFKYPDSGSFLYDIYGDQI